MAAQEFVDNTADSKSSDNLSSEQLERQIERTRESLVVKLSRLEEEVEGKVRTTVDHVSEQIVGTVDQITDKVKHSMEQVQGQLNLASHIEKDPFKTLGGVVLAGLAFGAWIASRSHSKQTRSSRPPQQFLAQPHGLLPLVKGMIGTLVVSTAQQVLQSKVHNYVDGLQRSGRL